MQINNLAIQLKISSKKVGEIFGGYVENLYFCTRFRERKVLQSGLRAASDWQIDTKRKTFFEKSSENIWSIFEKVFIFASAFEKTKATRKSEIFERFT